MRLRRLILPLSVLLLAAPAAPAADGPISTFAGTVPGLAGDGGPAGDARLDGPRGVALGPGGTVLIADTDNSRIRRVGAGGDISTFAGTDSGLSGDDGPAVDAQLREPAAVAVRPDGSALIADTGNDRIRMVGPDGTITTVAGTSKGLGGDGGPATQARLDAPTGLAVMPDGGYLIADAGNNRIRRVAPDGTITTVAGTSGGLGGDGGPATAARLESPRSVTLAGDGGFLVADTGNRRIRRVAPDGVISTVAGGGIGFAADGGPQAAADLAGPADVLPLDNGGLLIADADSDRVRRVTPLGAVLTVAGGRRGRAGDGGPASAAQLDTPMSLSGGAPGGGFLVADAGNSLVRRFEGLGALPPPEPLRTIGVAPARGSVTIRPRRRTSFIALNEPDLAPNVSVVDATKGAVGLTVRGLDSGREATARVAGGRFKLVQPVADSAIADLRLNGPLRCSSAKASKSREHARKKKRKRSRRIKIKVRGRYRTSGKYAVAVANGTAWTMTDFCDRTIIRVTEGRVTVRDLRRNRTVRVRAGKTYVALKRRPRR